MAPLEPGGLSHQSHPKMILTEIDVSPRELTRVSGLAYHGKSIRASLANDPGLTLPHDGLTSAYDALKISATGYSDYVATLAAGAYDPEDGQHEIGESAGANQFVAAKFGPFPDGATFNIIYYVVDGYSYIYGRTVLGATVLPPGSPEKNYPFLIGVA